jgi:Domain of unknown function (DU1801)
MQKSTTTTPDEHIASLPDDVRDDIVALDAAIAGAMPGEERVVWEGKFWGGTDQRIIGYGSYHYKGRSGAEGEWFIVGLAVQKNYLSLYVNAAEGGTYLSEVYGTRLGKVKAKRANIQVKRAADLDLDVLREMAIRARELTPRS